MVNVRYSVALLEHTALKPKSWAKTYHTSKKKRTEVDTEKISYKKKCITIKERLIWLNAKKKKIKEIFLPLSLFH